MSVEDHRQGFTAAMAALHAEFNACLDRDRSDPGADPVGYRKNDRHARRRSRDQRRPRSR
jgi:hypothetical protein